ncbi:MAG: HAD-IIIA family hydrolase [Candidatus Thorarchaeota archaeon]|jgi:histidinol-phosphate phosphatase family protein
MSQEVVMVMGLPASGKGTVSQGYRDQGYVWLNRDNEGGTVASLVPKLKANLQAGESVVLDNTLIAAETRKQFIDACKEHDVPIKCIRMGTSKEDAQFNACKRMIKKYGKILSKDEVKKVKSPNMFTASVIFAMAKKFEEPELDEGFVSVDTFPFVRKFDPSYTNRALILDYDGTLRKTGSGDKYPRSANDVLILPGSTRKLKQFADEGYKLLGVSNQSGVAKGALTVADAEACFKRTNQLVGHDIEYYYCPHSPVPPCYCRKPQVGFGVLLIEKHKLDAAKCIYVGDMTSDKTFAKRVGFQFKHADEFFGRNK